MCRVVVLRVVSVAVGSALCLISWECLARKLDQEARNPDNRNHDANKEKSASDRALNEG